MTDVETILRFFALRHVEFYQRGMQGFLDLYMVRGKSFSSTDLVFMEDQFVRVINLATDLYGKDIFRPWDTDKFLWNDQPQRAFADAVMVGLSRHLDKAEALLDKRDKIIDETKELFVKNPPGTFTGRGNSKEDVRQRIDIFATMLAAVLKE